MRKSPRFITILANWFDQRLIFTKIALIWPLYDRFQNIIEKLKGGVISDDDDDTFLSNWLQAKGYSQRKPTGLISKWKMIKVGQIWIYPKTTMNYLRWQNKQKGKCSDLISKRQRVERNVFKGNELIIKGV